MKRKPKPLSLIQRYPTQIAALRKICADMPGNAPTIVDDLLNERRGWYHATLLCYCDDIEPWQWQRVAAAYTPGEPA